MIKIITYTKKPSKCVVKNKGDIMSIFDEAFKVLVAGYEVLKKFHWKDDEIKKVFKTYLKNARVAGIDKINTDKEEK